MSLTNPQTDQEYQSRWEAETLAQAETIKDDPSRLQSAQAAAKVIADEKDKDQKSMCKIAGKKTRTPAPNQGTKGYSGPNNAPPKQSGGFNVFQKI